MLVLLLITMLLELGLKRDIGMTREQGMQEDVPIAEASRIIAYFYGDPQLKIGLVLAPSYPTEIRKLEEVPTLSVDLTRSRTPLLRGIRPCNLL